MKVDIEYKDLKRPIKKARVYSTGGGELEIEVDAGLSGWISFSISGSGRTASFKKNDFKEFIKLIQLIEKQLNE